MCCQKLVIAQKYSAKVRRNFRTPLTALAKTSASAEHYKPCIFCAPLVRVMDVVWRLCSDSCDMVHHELSYCALFNSIPIARAGMLGVLRTTDFYHATLMHSANYAVARCPSVYPSVTRRYCV